MERGVVVGAVLISISLLLAVILNASASRDALRIDGAGVGQSSSSGVGTDADGGGETAKLGAQCCHPDPSRDRKWSGAKCDPDVRRND